MNALNPSQKSELKARMLSRAGVLREEIAAVLHGGQPGEVEIAGMERDAAELAGIEAALERIDSPQYGLCADCRAPIALHRLVVEPQARRCVRCESESERRRARPNGPRL